MDYIIDKKGKINPVDKEITGVILKNSIYNEGLYQFLQMQNNLPITVFSININYLSNLGFFQRYIKKDSNSIYGLTGTIGSFETRRILDLVYKLDFDYIPPHKKRILKELESNLCFNQISWINKIKIIAKREIDANRAVLIICENIKIVDELYFELEKIS